MTGCCATFGLKYCVVCASSPPADVAGWAFWWTLIVGFGLWSVWPVLQGLAERYATWRATHDISLEMMMLMVAAAVGWLLLWAHETWPNPSRRVRLRDHDQEPPEP